jgi:hypothetical protein
MLGQDDLGGMDMNEINDMRAEQEHPTDDDIETDVEVKDNGYNPVGEAIDFITHNSNSLLP